MTKRKMKAVVDSDESDGKRTDSDRGSNKRHKSDSSSDSRNFKRRKPQPSHSDSETSDSDVDWDAPKKKKKLQTKSTLNKNAGKQNPGSNSEPEEGEVSDSDGSSNDSSSESELEFNDGYDADLIGDEEDRNRLQKMTEKEREQEIFNRLEKREVLKARFDIEKKLRMAKKQQKQKKEDRKSSDASKEKFSHHSISDRKKAIEESKKGMKYKFAELKAKRDRKILQEKEKLEAELKRKKQKEDSESGTEGVKKQLKYGDVFSSGESDNDSVKSKKSSHSSSSDSSSSDSDSDGDRSGDFSRPKEKTKYISCLEDLEKIRLSRHKVESFVTFPLFLKAVIGCYVRIGIGSNKGVPVYRVAEITEVVETGKVYSLGSIRTNKGFRLKHAGSERVFRLEFLSNSKFTVSEYETWVKDSVANNISLPTLDHVAKKTKDIHDMVYYTFSNTEIDEMVKEKNRFNHQPTNYAVAKTVLMKEKEIAMQKGDDETINRINGQLAEMEEKANAIHKKRTSSIAAISYINERNRKNNVEKAEQAILAEVLERKGMKNEDPFTRRSTRPTIICQSEKKDVQMTSALLKQLEDERKQNEELEKKKQEEELLKQKQEEERKKAEKRKQDLTHDPYDAHNFEIKIDIDAAQPMSAPPIAPRPTPAPVASSSTPSSGPKRSLKLEDYKLRKGLL